MVIIGAKPNFQKKDLEIILQALPEPNFVEIYAYPDPKTSTKVQALLKEIENQHKPYLLMDDRSCKVEIIAKLKTPSKQAILDFYEAESGPASFKEAVWHEYGQDSVSTLLLTPSSLDLFYLNSTPDYLPKLSKALALTNIKLDVKTEINGLKIVRP